MSGEDRAFEADPEVYKTLLESTRAIPWKIDWDSKQFAYIGPQIESLLGWPQRSWLTVQDWADRIHEEDRERVVGYCVSQSMAGIDHEADYRALTRDGRYIWIRDVVHVVRRGNGEPEALIGFMFDISERKKAEQELVRLKQELEELSLMDALTGVPNRRYFDTVLEREWARALHDRQPLSLILLDIDYFKDYNDHYGHIQGDECLKVVAATLARAGHRSRDFFARFGGEEFVLILPETDETAALTVAERCRSLLFRQQISHEASKNSQILTVSMGVGTIIPDREVQPLAFVESVDRLLYRAKQQGRNRIASG